ncbi:MAG: CDP-alcohol phosphatidyltransferase family protein [bacterium]
MRDPNKLYFHDKIIGALIDPIIPRSVKPNHITLLRFCLIPFVVLFLLLENYTVGIPLFILTALTDVMDGTLARIRKQVTDWGKLYDPLADKLLIGSVLIIVVFHYANIVLALTLVALDLATIVAGIVRVKRGMIMMANGWGKAKMCFQVTGVTALLLAQASGWDFFIPFSNATLGLAIILALISLLSYGI